MRQQIYQGKKLPNLACAFTGPESTGKTTLAKELAGHYGGLYLCELARPMLEKGQFLPPYSAEHIEQIALAQCSFLESIQSQKLALPLFADTELSVLQIWLEEATASCPIWLGQAQKALHFDLYFLCDIDCPWEQDPLREHGEESSRRALFDRYQELLRRFKRKFFVLSGSLAERKILAQRHIEAFLD